MKVIFPYSLRDQEQAVRLAEWIKELGGCEGHSVLVVRDHRTNPEAGDILKSAFGKWEEIVIRDDAYDHWPESPNLMLRRAAKHIEYGTREPWLWLEPDVAPLKTGWIDAIEAEYKEVGKPFLGDFVHLNEPGFKSHMSGVAVYPGVMSHHAGDALLAHETAWDVVAAGQIIPQMHKSKLILHLWKHPTFESWEQVEQRIFAVKPEAVLFHASKDGSLIARLREQVGGVAKLADASDLKSDGPQARDGSNPSTATCDILIKSYPPDYERLRYCLRSIDKFATGFRRVVLLIPYDTDAFMGLTEMSNISSRVMRVPESGEGYLSQQTFKAQAHEYTDADCILHIDSDCIFTEPVTPEMFMRDSKPIWYKTPYSSGLEVPWEAITEKFMQAPVEYEFMRRFPFLVPRFLHEAIAAFCQETHSKSLTDYILAQPVHAFSEFNALGALAHVKFHDQFHWIDTTKDEVPKSVVIQKWSKEEFTDATKAEFEEILNGKPIEHPVESFSTSGPPVTLEPNSEAAIRQLAETLKGFMGNSVETRRVRNVLHEVGVIQLPYRFKRRKGWKRKKAKAT